METYSLLREFADSWVLLAMFGFFAGAILWVFRPSNALKYRDASLIPLRNEAAPSGPPCGAHGATPLSNNALREQLVADDV